MGSGAEDAFDRVSIDWRALKGAVQIDQMQPFAARVLEGDGLRGGIVAKHSCLVHLTLQQAHTLAVFQVDGGIEDHVVRLLSALGRCFSWTGAIAKHRRDAAEKTELTRHDVCRDPVPPCRLI